MNYKSLLLLFVSLNLYSQECYDFINSSTNIESNTFFSVGELFVIYETEKQVEEIEATPIAYPNPTTGILNIKFTDESENDFIEIYDITGRNVKNFPFEKNSRLDITNFSIGIYFIKSKLNSFPTFKIIKK